jgi:hypothetical protein
VNSSTRFKDLARDLTSKNLELLGTIDTLNGKLKNIEESRQSPHRRAPEKIKTELQGSVISLQWKKLSSLEENVGSLNAKLNQTDDS